MIRLQKAHEDFEAISDLLFSVCFFSSLASYLSSEVKTISSFHVFYIIKRRWREKGVHLGPSQGQHPNVRDGRQPRGLQEGWRGRDVKRFLYHQLPCPYHQGNYLPMKGLNSIVGNGNV